MTFPCHHQNGTSLELTMASLLIQLNLDFDFFVCGTVMVILASRTRRALQQREPVILSANGGKKKKLDNEIMCRIRKSCN